jgi:hypothetical protein
LSISKDRSTIRVRSRRIGSSRLRENAHLAARGIPVPSQARRSKQMALSVAARGKAKSCSFDP